MTEEWDSIQIHRFRYAFSERQQKLVYPAILPNIRHKRWLLIQIPFLLVAELIALLSLARRLHPDVLYSHWFVPQGVVGGIASILLKVPHVFTSHSSDVQVMKSVPVVGPALLRFLVRRVDACTVVSHRSLQKLRAFFPDRTWPEIEKKVSVIPMGVDVTSLQRDLPCSRESTRSRVILFIGRLSEKKGVTFLLKALKMLIDRRESHDPNRAAVAIPELWIAGEGELSADINAEIAVLGLDRITRMLGYIGGEDKLACFAAADILAVPSIITDDGDAEGLPVSLIEGLAAGKLCRATDVSGADEILVDGQNGFLIAQKNVTALAEALNKALEISEDAAADMCRKARDTAQSLDWSVIARRHWEHLFDPLLQQP